LSFAKRLLDETRLPISEVALAAGFGSLRRFNSVFRRTYGRAPRDLRRPGHFHAGLQATGEVTLKLAFRPPYDFGRLLTFLRARAIPGVERVDAISYSRTVRIGAADVIVRVGLVDDEDALELRVSGAAPADLFHLSTTARRVFDLSADPAQIEQAFRSDKTLGPLVARSPGLRIPGVWDPFECAVRAIVGQQVSVRGACTLTKRLVERIGARTRNPGPGLTTLFPSPAAIAEADLQRLGLTRARVAAIQGLARAVIERKVDFAGGADQIMAALTQVAGIGEWTAEYVAFRALGEPDSFPAADLVLRRMAGRGRRALSEAELESLAESWRPWRAYAALYLWDAAARSIT